MFACTVPHSESCLHTIILLFCKSMEMHIYNKWKQQKSIHLYDIYCDADKVHVQIKAHHQSKHHRSQTHLRIASI